MTHAMPREVAGHALAAPLPPSFRWMSDAMINSLMRRPLRRGAVSACVQKQRRAARTAGR